VRFGLVLYWLFSPGIVIDDLKDLCFLCGEEESPDNGTHWVGTLTVLFILLFLLLKRVVFKYTIYLFIIMEVKR